MATLRKITLNWEIRTGAITCDTGYIKRQELCDVDLYVTVDGTAYALDTSWALNLSIKPALLGDNAALVAVTTWTASATTGLYQATAQTIGGTALDTYLAANNADTTDDEGNKLVDLDVYYTVSMAMRAKSDTVTVICKPDVGRADDTVPATIIARNDFLVSNGTGLLVNVAAGYAANGAFVAAQASLAITNATNYIEVTAAGVASVNTTAFSAGSYPLATVVASAGAITANTDLRAWITPKPATAGGVTSITGTANEITVTGTTTPTLSLPSALTFTGKTVTNGTFNSPTFTTPISAEYRGTDDGGTHGYLVMNSGSGIASNGGVINVSGGSTNFRVGGNIYTYGATRAGGNISTFDGGGSIITNAVPGNSGTLSANISASKTLTLLSTNDYTLTADTTGTVVVQGGALGTPASGVGTNLTGTAASLTAGNVTTIPALSGAITNTGNATVLGSFTMAQLSTAVSDGDPAYVGAANTFTGTTNTFTLPTTTGSTTTSGIAVAANSITTGTGVYIGSSSASNSSTTAKLLHIEKTGAQTGTVTNTAATISNTCTGASTTNVALTLISSGAATSNKGLNFTGVGSVSNPHISLSDGSGNANNEVRIYQTSQYRMTVGFANTDRFMFDNTHGCASLLDNAYPLGSATYRWNSITVGTGAAVFGGTLAVTGASTFTGNIIAGSATMALLNTTATTVNFAGAATTLTVGKTDATTVITFGNGLTLDTNSGVARIISSSPLIQSTGGNIYIVGRLGPLSTNTYELGATGARWSKLWATNADLSGTLAVTGASTLTGLLTANGGITLGDAQNIAFNTTTGTKIGAATTQKLSFWNATPIVQPTTAVASATVVSPGGGTNLKTDDTFDGYTIAQVVKALRNAGLLA